MGLSGIFHAVLVLTTVLIQAYDFLKAAPERFVILQRANMAALSWTLVVELLGAVILLCLARRIAKWLIRTDNELAWPGSDFRLVSLQGFRFCVKFIGVSVAASAIIGVTLGNRQPAASWVFMLVTLLTAKLVPLLFGLYLVMGGDWLVRFAWGNPPEGPETSRDGTWNVRDVAGIAIVLIGCTFLVQVVSDLTSGISQFVMIPLQKPLPSTDRWVLIGILSSRFLLPLFVSAFLIRYHRRISSALFPGATPGDLPPARKRAAWTFWVRAGFTLTMTGSVTWILSNVAALWPWLRPISGMKPEVESSMRQMYLINMLAPVILLAISLYFMKTPRSLISFARLEERA